jgi:hypothetical protein
MIMALMGTMGRLMMLESGMALEGLSNCRERFMRACSRMAIFMALAENWLSIITTQASGIWECQLILIKLSGFLILMILSLIRLSFKPRMK